MDSKYARSHTKREREEERDRLRERNREREIMGMIRKSKKLIKTKGGNIRYKIIKNNI